MGFLCFYYNYCKKYNDWFIKHEIVYIRQKHIENTILSITKCLDYRPRLEKLNQLKVLYAQWEKDNRAYIATRFKEMKQIEENKTVFEYHQMKVLKDNILKKMEICQKLKDVDRDIKNISDKITRNQTVYAVNEKNDNDPERDSDVPKGVKKIYDMGVFAVTATSSIFAYIWIWIILLDQSISTLEAWLTFIFFFILIGLAFAMDKYKAMQVEKANKLAEGDES